MTYRPPGAVASSSVLISVVALPYVVVVVVGSLLDNDWGICHAP